MRDYWRSQAAGIAITLAFAVAVLIVVL